MLFILRKYYDFFFGKIIVRLESTFKIILQLLFFLFTAVEENISAWSFSEVRSYCHQDFKKTTQILVWINLLCALLSLSWLLHIFFCSILFNRHCLLCAWIFCYIDTKSAHLSPANSIVSTFSPLYVVIDVAFLSLSW